MSQPKKRKHIHHTTTPKAPARGVAYQKIIPVAVIIFMLFGIGISFFAAGLVISWLVAGGIIGALCGFLFGYQVAKGLSRK